MEPQTAKRTDTGTCGAHLRWRSVLVGAGVNTDRRGCESAATDPGLQVRKRAGNAGLFSCSGGRRLRITGGRIALRQGCARERNLTAGFYPSERKLAGTSIGEEYDAI